jgi:D-amino-acid dehydrogenase
LIGVSCAVVLAREGYSVSLFDELPAGHGCSLGNGAQYNAGSASPMAKPGVIIQALRWLIARNGPLVLKPRHLCRMMPWLSRFIVASREPHWHASYGALHALNQSCASTFREILGENEWHRLFRPTGALHVWGKGLPGYADTLLSHIHEALGVKAVALTANDIRDLEPTLSTAYQSGVLFPDSGFVLSPLELVNGLLARAIQHGCAVRREKVLAVTPRVVGVELQTDRDTQAYDQVVIAAGISTFDFARRLGVNVPLTGERGYSITIQGGVSGLTRPVTDADSALVATPLEEGLRIVGIAEFNASGAPPDYKQCEKLMAQARFMLPGMEIENVTKWMGIRPSTPDSLPIIDRHPRYARILFASGHGHTGISGAPMTGLLIADLVAGRATRIDRAPYRLR